MKEKMKCLIMTGKRAVKIAQIDIPEPGDDQVLIRVKSVGICGSDIHYYKEGKIGEAEVEFPFVLGHEIGGMIMETGKYVEGLKKGDLVAVEAGIPCGNCSYCRSGHYNLCNNMQFLATPPVQGGMAEYIVYPASWVHLLPETMNTEEAALLEPLVVGLQSVETGECDIGHRIFIFGCGCIGLVTLLSLKAKGISEIYMCDVEQSRIDKAKELGALEVFQAQDDHFVGKVLQNTGGVDVVFEMTGTSECTAASLELVKKGGKIVLVGLGGNENVPFNFEKMIWNEVEIRTCFRYRNMYPKAIQAVASGVINIRDIISDRVMLEDVPEALEKHIEKNSGIIKMVVTL